MADVGDWVIGTGGNGVKSAGHGRLIYAMQVTEKIPLRRYATDRRYAGRADRAPQDRTDRKRFVLISRHFFYFGRNAIDLARIPVRYLTHGLEKRGPNYRRDFPEASIADLERWLSEGFSIGVHGEPCGGRPPHWKVRSGRCTSHRPVARRICNPLPTFDGDGDTERNRLPKCPPPESPKFPCR
jgi:hypothetical protein